MTFRVKKVFRLVLLTGVIGLAYLSLLTISDFSLQHSTREALFLNLRVLYNRLYANTLNLKVDDLRQKANEILTEKFKDYSPPSLQYLRSDYKLPTKILIPQYFVSASEVTTRKPLLQPFDPRFTLSVYLRWIRENPGKSIPFHWSDWVDLSALNQYILLPDERKETCQKLFELTEDQRKQSSVLQIEQYCVNEKSFPLGYKVTGFPRAQSRENNVILAKSYLYSSFPSPSQLVFLTNNHGSYLVEINDRKNELKQSLLQNKLPEEIFVSRDSTHVDVLDSYRLLIETQKPQVEYHDDPLQIHLDESFFDIDIDNTIMALGKVSKKRQEESYLSSLKYSKEVKQPKKSFREVKLLKSDSQRVFGDHHDWRFFNGLTINTDKQAIVLHRIMKSYLLFCRTHGLITWIAHGSLLSWYWNGMIFPWDADTDVQMPIRDLHRLARDFNQSLVIENIGHDMRGYPLNEMDFNGMGTYYIDVGTSITHREYENGLNNIDARFIDVQTGLYVDITGLAVSNEKAPGRYDGLRPTNPEPETNRINNKLSKLYNCRNRHFASLSELSPLVKSVVQNEVGYVPQNFSPLLKNEYRIEGMLEFSFNGYYYLSAMRLWVKASFLIDYTKNPGNWIDHHTRLSQREISVEEANAINNLTETDFANLLNDERVLREFLSSSNFTQFHEEQMSYLLSSRMKKYYLSLEKYVSGEQVGRPIWPDLFMNEIAVNGWDYEDEVRKANALVEIYQKIDSEASKAPIADTKNS